MKRNHQDESGKPTSNRGKPPHQGGYCAGVGKRIKHFIYYVIRKENRDVAATSPWKPGGRRIKSVPQERTESKNAVPGSKIMGCNCIDAYQDKLYGPGKRVHNTRIKGKIILGHACTCCGTKK